MNCRSQCWRYRLNVTSLPAFHCPPPPPTNLLRPLGLLDQPLAGNGLRWRRRRRAWRQLKVAERVEDMPAADDGVDQRVVARKLVLDQVVKGLEEVQHQNMVLRPGKQKLARRKHLR